MTIDELAQAARDDGWEVAQTTEAIEFRGFGRVVTYWTWTELLEIERPRPELNRVFTRRTPIRVLERLRVITMWFRRNNQPEGVTK